MDFACACTVDIYKLYASTCIVDIPQCAHAQCMYIVDIMYTLQTSA